MANKQINILMSLQDKFTKPLKGITDKTNEQKKQIKAATNVINRWAKNANQKFKSVAGTVGKMGLALGTLGGVISVAGIKAWAGEAQEAARAQIEAETKLEAVLGNVKSIAAGGNDAILEAKASLMGVASGLQKVGVIGDEVTLAGMQQLATFQLSHKEISMLSAGMTDLLAQQKGLNATQEDAVSIGNMIGKVMQGQTSALSRVGITFDAAQEAALKMGTAEERAAVLAEILQQNVGGVNAALAQTDQGKIQQAANLYGDMQEEVGKGLLSIKAQLMGLVAGAIPGVQEKLVGLVARLQAKVNAAIAFLEAHKAQLVAGLNTVKSVVSTVYRTVSKAVGWIIGHGNILLPILAGIVAGFTAFSVITKIVGILNVLIPVMQGVSAAGGLMNLVMMANPAIRIAAAIAALVAAGVLLYKNWDVIREKAAALWDKAKAVFGGIKDAIAGAFDGAKATVNRVIDWIGEKIGWLGNKIRSIPVIGDAVKAIGSAAGWVREKVSGHATGSSYFRGGVTRINEGGRGEIVDLPSGSRIIPHDVSKKTGGGMAVNLKLVVQGNVIGNRAFMEQTGDYVVSKVIEALGTV